MCCVFTCCGWMIDLLQRVWTFAMSCCISSAICCVMMTSSLSGIALGYNYSLAEYIDLKETNVSVYLKRGVFDDEIADDMEWRRSGHLPVGDNQFPDETLVTGGPDVEPERRSGRRLEDSVFETNDHNKFEGSLMRLTAKPLDEPITRVTYTPDLRMGEIQEKYQNDLDKMKAIQELLNMRRNNQMTTTASARRQMGRGRYATGADRPQPHEMFPPSGLKTGYSADILSGRKYNPHDPNIYTFLNPARTAVPPHNIGDAGNWKLPKDFTVTRWTYGLYNEISPETPPTYPGPIPLNLGPIRPTTRRGYTGERFVPKEVVNIEKMFGKEKPGESEEVKSAEEIDQKMLKQKMDKARARIEDVPQRRQEGGEEDYDLDAKGLPIRKKRDIGSSSTLPPTTLNVFSSMRKRRQPSSITELPTSLDKIKTSHVSPTETLSKISKILLLDKLMLTTIT